MRLVLAEPVLHARPGGAAVEALLWLTNTGSVVDRPTVSLEGIEPAWYRLSPSRPALAPGEEVVVRLEVQVPEGAHAGPRPFRVTAHSAVAVVPGASAWGAPSVARNVAEGTLEVAPAAQVEMELVPRRRRSRHGAEYAVRLRNTGNVDQILRLTSDGSGESMRVEVWPDEVLVAAGSEVWGRAHAAPARRSFTGRPRAHVFWLSAQPVEDALGSPLTQTVGELHVSPPFSFIPVVYDFVTRHVPVVLISLVGLGLLAWFRAPVMERAAAPPPTPVVVATSTAMVVAAPTPVAVAEVAADGESALGDVVATPGLPASAGSSGLPASPASPVASATPEAGAGSGVQAPSVSAPQAAPTPLAPQRLWITLGVPGGEPVQVPVMLPGGLADLRVEPRDVTAASPPAPGIERFEYAVTSGGGEAVLTAYVLRPVGG